MEISQSEIKKFKVIKWSYPTIIIYMEDMQFYVALEWQNIVWGMVPRTDTKRKAADFKAKNDGVGVMCHLIPEIIKATNRLLDEEKPPLVTIESRTNKGRDLYRTWKQYFPNYICSDSDRGISLLRKDIL